MSAKSPLVFVDGGFSELPPGDSIQGVALGSLIAGSGLSGGGDLNTGSKNLSIKLNANPSGLTLNAVSIGLDGSDIAQANTALASGNAALASSVTATASGTAAQSLANTALASGNAALSNALNFTGSSVIQLQASTFIPAYAPVGLGDDGKAQVVRTSVTDNSSPLTYNTPVVFESATTNYSNIIYSNYVQAFLVVYADAGNSNYGTGVGGILTNTSLTFGTPTVFNSAATDSTVASLNTTQSQGFIIYRDASVSYYGRIIWVNLALSPNYGTPLTFKSQSTSPLNVSAKLDGGDFILTYRDASASNYPGIIAGCVSGSNAFTLGASVTTSTSALNSISACSVPNSRDFLVAYDAGGVGYVRGISISDLTISFTTAITQFDAGPGASYVNILYDSQYSKFILFYDNANTSLGYYRVGTYSGSSISFAAASVQFISTYPSFLYATYDSSFARYIVSYQGTSSYGNSVCGRFDGSTITFGTASVFNSAVTTYISSAHSADDRATVVAYKNGSTTFGTARVLNPLYQYSYLPTASSVFNYVGLSKAATPSGSVVSVAPPKTLIDVPATYNRGSVYYLNPVSSGISADSTTPVSWPSSVSWRPVARAVSASGLLLLRPI